MCNSKFVLKIIESSLLCSRGGTYIVVNCSSALVGVSYTYIIQKVFQEYILKSIPSICPSVPQFSNE